MQRKPRDGARIIELALRREEQRSRRRGFRPTPGVRVPPQQPKSHVRVLKDGRHYHNTKGFRTYF